MASEDPRRKTAIQNVRIFDGEKITEPRTVVIQDGLITSDANNAEVVDGKGHILIPGLIDCHVHLQDERDLHNLASWRVTTALGMAEWPPEKVKRLRGHVGLTDIRSPGLPATSPGSIHSKLLPLPPENYVSTPEQAPDFVKERIEEGADYIKVIADIPGPDQLTLNALVTAAHGAGKVVIGHASAFTPYAMAQEAKVDVVTHVPWDKALDEEAVARMVAEGRISVPTLTMLEGLTKRPSWTAIMRILMQPIVLFMIINHFWKHPRRGPTKYEYARDSVTALYKAEFQFWQAQTRTRSPARRSRSNMERTYIMSSNFLPPQGCQR